MNNKCYVNLDGVETFSDTSDHFCNTENISIFS